MANALHRYRRAGMMGGAGARTALEAALALPIHLYAEPELYGRALDLAERLSLPVAYDAHYLALAEWLGAEFWTADGRLVQSVQVDLAWVRLLEVGG